MTPVAHQYEALLIDLDGTVYHGSRPVAGAAEAVRQAREARVGVRFVTNNAARPPVEVAEQLVSLGIPCDSTEVSTSAQAAAALLAAGTGAGDAVLVLGTEALADEVRHAGFRPVDRADERPGAVVQGFNMRTGWPELAEACIAIDAGCDWVACNTDSTLPTERGALPGNGAFVAALTAATGRHPVVAGKPGAALLRRAMESCGAAEGLVVGDRLDTDIAGANNAGLHGMLVLSGVSTPRDLLAAPAGDRPRYVGQDIGAIRAAPEDVLIGVCPDWSVRVDGAGLRVAAGRPGADSLALLRCLCAVWWDTGEQGLPAVYPGDDHVRVALRELGLDSLARSTGRPVVG